MYMLVDVVYFKCPKCGKRVQKHIVKDGARYHVKSWSLLNNGESDTTCSEKDCEVNHKCG